MQMMATSVVLATLSILPYERALFGRTDDLSAEQEKERTIRMATILGFTVDKRVDTKNILTRSALVSSINSMNLLAMVPAEVRGPHAAQLSMVVGCSGLAGCPGGVSWA